MHNNENDPNNLAENQPSGISQNVSEEGPSQEILDLYQEYIPGYLSEFAQAVNDNNEEQVMFHCHKMMSAMKIMEFDHIVGLLETIQKENPKGERLNDLADQLKQYIKQSLIPSNQ